RCRGTYREAPAPNARRAVNAGATREEAAGAALHRRWPKERGLVRARAGTRGVESALFRRTDTDHEVDPRAGIARRDRQKKRQRATGHAHAAAEESVARRGQVSAMRETAAGQLAMETVP